VNGYDCVDLCRDSQSCDFADPADCKSQCEELEGFLDVSDCDDSFRQVLRCMSRLDDPCSQQDVCTGEIDDFATCVVQNCDVRPDKCPFY
jgi:hypothetical protein